MRPDDDDDDDDQRASEHLRKKKKHKHTNCVISSQIQFLPPKTISVWLHRPRGTVIVVIMLKLMLHSYSCVSCIVIRFFFFSSTEVSFKCFFGAWRLMTTWFPTEMFNQCLIRGGVGWVLMGGGAQTHSASRLIWFFTFLFGVPHLSICGDGDTLWLYTVHRLHVGVSLLKLELNQ